MCRDKPGQHLYLVPFLPEGLTSGCYSFPDKEVFSYLGWHRCSGTTILRCCETLPLENMLDKHLLGQSCKGRCLQLLFSPALCFLQRAQNRNQTPNLSNTQAPTRPNLLPSMYPYSKKCCPPLLGCSTLPRGCHRFCGHIPSAAMLTTV